MSACSRNYKFGHGMLALHVLSVTARILTMAQHVRAQNHRMRALTIRVRASTIRPNGLCKHESRSRETISLFPQIQECKQQRAQHKTYTTTKQELLHPIHVIHHPIHSIYTNAGLLQPVRTYHTRSMAVYKSQDFGTINHLS